VVFLLFLVGEVGGGALVARPGFRMMRGFLLEREDEVGM